MKQWTSATLRGQCGGCGREWEAGERIGLLTGRSWQKRRCADCFVRVHGAEPDTGELVDASTDPRMPAFLRDAVLPVLPEPAAEEHNAGTDTDPVCVHGVALDVHCCDCRRSGFFPPDDCRCVHPLLEGPAFEEPPAAEVTTRASRRRLDPRAAAALDYGKRAANDRD